MKLKKYLINEEEKLLANLEISEADDFGKDGRDFEGVFTRACELVGLDFDKNGFKGRIWDIHPKGMGWEKLISDQNVNIKTGGTKWMFSSSELYKTLPWQDKPKNFSATKAAGKVKNMFNELGVDDTVFLKPKDSDIQAQIVKMVNEKNIQELNKLLVEKNFYADKIGKDYTVRILTNEERVTSIVIDKDDKVFMRSEKPRAIGAGKGTVTVTFRTPTSKLGIDEKKVKNI